MRCNRRITHKNNQQDTESEHVDYTVTKNPKAFHLTKSSAWGEDIQQDARFGADAAMLHAVLLEDGVALVDGTGHAVHRELEGTGDHIGDLGVGWWCSGADRALSKVFSTHIRPSV